MAEDRTDKQLRNGADDDLRKRRGDLQPNRPEGRDQGNPQPQRRQTPDRGHHRLTSLAAQTQAGGRSITQEEERMRSYPSGGDTRPPR